MTRALSGTLDLSLAKSTLCGHRTLSSSGHKELPSNIKSKPLVSRPASSDSAAEMLATKPTKPSLESFIEARASMKESGLAEAEKSSRQARRKNLHLTLVSGGEVQSTQNFALC